MPASVYAVFLKSPKSMHSPGCLDRKSTSLVSSERFHWPAACGVSPDSDRGGEPWLLPLVLLLHICIMGEAKKVMIITITQWSCCYIALYPQSLWHKKHKKKKFLLPTRLLYLLYESKNSCPFYSIAKKSSKFLTCNFFGDFWRFLAYFWRLIQLSGQIVWNFEGLSEISRKPGGLCLDKSVQLLDRPW